MAPRDFIRRHPPLLAVVRMILSVLRQLRFFLTGHKAISSVSTKYEKLTDIDTASEVKRLRSSWQDEALPARQRALVDRQLLDFRSGKPVEVFDVYIQALRGIEGRLPVSSLLEIGCSSGYYSEVMKIAGSGLSYAGCDYSEALVRLARQRHPDASFDVEDATGLSYEDNAFDIVVSGCCLLHIPEYGAAIAEAARVAASIVIFHRTPVLLNSATEFYRKEAYGVETIEIHFSEVELLELFARNGLKVDEVVDISIERLPSGAVRASRTYVCSLMVPE